MRLSLTRLVSCMAVPATILLASSGALSAALSSPAKIYDPMGLYGPQVEFDVLRNGKKIGTHHIRFSGTADELTVDTESKLQIDFLFFTAFRFHYQSTARWKDGMLKKLVAKVDDNGKKTSFTAQRAGNRLRIVRAQQAEYAALPLFPTNHWNSGVLQEERVLNTLTGRINLVTIEPEEQESVMTNAGNRMATRYRYNGQLQTEVWYDADGRWVRMRFAGRDGSTLEYVCRRCSSDNLIEAKR